MRTKIKCLKGFFVNDSHKFMMNDDDEKKITYQNLADNCYPNTKLQYLFINVC